MKRNRITTQQHLGVRIAEARQAAGLTQAQLAQRIQLDRTALSRVETGDRRVDAVELVDIAIALGRPVGVVFSELKERHGPALPRSTRVYQPGSDTVTGQAESQAT